MTSLLMQRGGCYRLEFFARLIASAYLEPIFADALSGARWRR